MLTLCIVTTILLGIFILILMCSAVMNYLVADYEAGHLALFGIICHVSAIVNIWLLYCN